ncbi:MAG: hypothetical protein ACRDZ3_03370 [Acidimicrobiia bacterium]
MIKPLRIAGTLLARTEARLSPGAEALGTADLMLFRGPCAWSLLVVERREWMHQNGTGATEAQAMVWAGA